MPPLKIIGSKLLVLSFTLLLSSTLLADTASSRKLQADFSKSALPILQQSCFACHGPKPQSTDNITDPDLKKKADKMIAKAQKNFLMGETFPFPESDSPLDDLKDISKSLKKGWMPPKSQKAMNLGQPLSDQDKKTLLDWVDRAKQELN